MNTICNRVTAFALVMTSLLYALGAQAGNYKLPKYQTIKLNNGLTIYLMEQHEVPLIDVNLVIKAGAIHDGNSDGLSRLTVNNLLLGTRRQSKNEIAESLDFIGAKLDADSNTETSTIGASFVGKDQQKVLGIIRDMVISPRFEQSEFDKYRSRYLLKLAQQKERPRTVIHNYFKKMLFGEQGYGTAAGGDSESIKAIALDDIKTFHADWYQPQNAAVIVVGDFDSQIMSKQLKRLFGGWKNGKKPPFPAPAPMGQFSHSKVLLVDKPDAMETAFMIGGQGIARNNPDFVAISVVNTILGGRFTSWLNTALRVDAGLTYGAYSRFNSYSRSGSFYLSTYTKTETTIEAIDLALKTYRRLWREGIDERTLASAKAYVKGQFPPKYETSTQLAGLLGEMFVYGFDQDFINRFEQRVNSLTPGAAKEIIAQYFPKSRLQFVLIGKAAMIRESLKKYGKVSEVSITDVGFK